ncbi:MAG TPA: NADH-quinone oxidoreductase subunit L [Casimicrobiaceae bacterium]|nr:NADH-quinone oxidoreductase subunit L [Casimicrobiaceae bacterium]
MTMESLYLVVPMVPLLASILVGLWGTKMPRAASHWITILAVAISFAASVVIFRDVLAGHDYNGDLYVWANTGGVKMAVGFLIDPLTALMLIVVTFVSLMVHIYTIGYMADDDGYSRFFSYICLFTFSMLMLVMSNNFLQLFFGWEAVGLVSYLLIGFWFKRPTAIYANLKAFIANRVGDFGFILGIGLVLAYFGSMDYAPVFAKAPELAKTTINIWGSAEWSLLTVACICLFVGAMGKSAQVPLHVWLPDSMEGPTPISALIHAATMVTAGIFMVARMSPLFEQSDVALGLVTVIGATGALFLGILGMVAFDIKRVVAYSTLSQLGYMTVALGVSSYAGAIFHLMTHAFFKALLFLGAGSVIIAMHHEQDMRNMGGLRRYMPITYFTMVIGGLALCGIPPFAGFFSKDSIIEATQLSAIPGHGYAYFCVVVGVFVTAFYTFRLLYMTFHGEERFRHPPLPNAYVEHDAHDERGEHHAEPRESPWVVTVPLIMLAIPSVLAGWVAIEPLLFGDYFKESIVVLPAHDVLDKLKEEWHGVGAFIGHGLLSGVLWIAVAGIAAATYLYLVNPKLPSRIAARAGFIYTILVNNYYFDKFNDWFFAGGARRIGNLFSDVGDGKIIEGIVNGSARTVAWWGSVMRQMQSGYVYHYAFTMIIGLFALLTWWVVR